MNYLKEYSEENKQCQHIGCNKQGTWRRQNTNYYDDKQNWACFCPECQEEADDHWKEMWAEYYGNIMG